MLRIIDRERKTSREYYRYVKNYGQNIQNYKYEKNDEQNVESYRKV